MTNDYNIRPDMKTSKKRDMNLKREKTMSAYSLLAKAMLMTLLFLCGGVVSGAWA